QGIGFALPVNTAVNVYNQLVKTGRVSRGSLGVGFSPDQRPETLKVYGAQHGVFVTNVESGSPAGKAGIEVEDVIVEYNGRPVKDGDDLVGRVSATPVGSQAAVTVLRGGKRMEFHVTIGERAKVWANDPRFLKFQRSEPGGDETPSPVKFGLDVQNLSQSARKSAGLGQKGGVVVTSVVPDSFAEDIDLEPHDVITSINRHEVTSVDDVRRIQGGLKPGDAVVMRVMRPLSKHPARAGDWQPVFLSGTLLANP
ncbi:MAG: PDZ domain-containing protein, partial [Bryobacteraceae bacterium]